MGIVFGLVSALCIDLADFLTHFAIQRAGTYQTFFYMQAVGFFAFTFVLLFLGSWRQVQVSRDWEAWAWTLLAALLNTWSYLALYRALEVGLLVLISPIVSSYAAVTVALSVLSGEQLKWTALLGIGAVLLGIGLTVTVLEHESTPHQDNTSPVLRLTHPAARRFPPGSGWAVAASLGFGITFWLLGFRVTPVVGGIAPIWLFRLVPLCLLAPFCAATHRSLRLPRRSVWMVILSIGLLDTAAFLTNLLGFTTGQVAIVSILQRSSQRLDLLTKEKEKL